MTHELSRAPLLASVLVLLVGSSASAHPGHGNDGGSYQLVHYLTEPVHLVEITAVVLVAIGATVLGRFLMARLRRNFGFFGRSRC